MQPELVPVHLEKPALLSFACSRSQMRIIVGCERRTNKTAFDAFDALSILVFYCYPGFFTSCELRL